MTSGDWNPLSTPPPTHQLPGHSSLGLISPNFNKENSNIPAKRSLDSKQGNPTKKTKLLEAPKDFKLPEPMDMPVISFPSTNKPPFSYANMIGMALLRAPERKLTLAQIYEWIMSHFPYYMRTDPGWQNSIRHNLSLNKSFEKTEKSKDKKGHFWKIVDGREFQFCNIKESKRNSNSPSSGGTTTSNKKSNKKSSSSIVSASNGDDSSDSSSDDSRLNSSNIPIPSTPVSKTSSSFDDNVEITPKSSPFNFKTPITSHNIGLLQSSPMIFDSPIANMTHSIHQQNVQVNGGSAGGNQTLDFTCSFSSSNFEMSPMGPVDQGPILEPITPQRCQKHQLPSIHQQLQSLHHHAKHNVGFKTPLMGTTTPLTGKRHIWASPSYLDEFLLSPIPKNQQQQFSGGITSPVKLAKKFGNVYSTNEIFGIDICSINNHDDDVSRLK